MFRIQLKKLRENSEYKSQRAFAEKIGVSQSTVGNWESGTREPNLHFILKIAQTLNVSVDDLLGNTASAAAKANLFNEQSGYWDGNRLTEERIAHGYSVKQISSLLDISEGEYACLESGSFEPSFALLLRMADVFSYDMDYLCHRTMKLDSSSTQHSESEELLIKMYRGLSYEGQSAIWALAKTLYDSQIGEKANSAPKQA